MESMKHKLVMALLVLCLIAVAAAIWYMIAVMPDGMEKEGTLVEAIPGLEMMVS
ncbi:hypothetical protein [Clostridium sp. Marseille-P2415]|uniref:hypothetical protein n=1 Tax=Clostridium sp. Marseille-P2415 TaxID=1805471 RepID=UPI00190E6511|nr:hypothetical protein [Clostridium sp. Marseille-P2415]